MPVSGNRGPPRDTGPSIEDSLREAESRSLDFPAAERSIYIRAMVKRTQELRAAGRSLDDIKTLLPEFVRDYPHSCVRSHTNFCPTYNLAAASPYG